MHDKVTILNCDILRIKQTELLKDLKKGVLLTPNLDHLVKLQKDEEFYQCYKSAEWVVCDSKILWICSKVLKKSFPEPIPGSSFFTHFYQYQAEKYKQGGESSVRIFLLGSPKQETAELAMNRINEKCGCKMVIGAHSPSFGFEKKDVESHEIVRMIRESGANVVLVGVGAPKQEKWIMRWKDEMPDVKIWMALGATIEFEAGSVQRAPKFFQKFALEWLYRIWCEPKRMAKRYFCDLVFFWYFLKQIIGVYKNPFAEK